MNRDLTTAGKKSGNYFRLNSVPPCFSQHLYTLQFVLCFTFFVFHFKIVQYLEIIKSFVENTEFFCAG